MIILAALLAYILGSVPFGYLTSKYLWGVDITKKGSGNIGATNVYRNLGPYPGAITALGDVGKGMLAVYIGSLLAGERGALVASFFVVIGHAYSIFLKFHGGKIVATTFGVLIMTSIKVTVVVFFIWLTVMLISRYVSLGSIVCGLSIPLIMLLFGLDWSYVYLGIFLAVMIFYRHRDNIKRLLSGTENKIGTRKKG
ncbi:acyl-phosphate glycerol 3-phosphate acyltransferase [Carboxydothermus islandicus]|uniref:Glycerol-3-phosphate acyltransferase n=1 Tax=Carboxydothermus islandicus TaxID=661089 RepID=A0A1L8D2Y0_9THEO|nr:glycerol-3-phosphate 1-O-acyltransferase PlsY [Carboxydothermus islandicus]GAV25441.1 acyl-phosphate glycerol 3-phosphate acyltransferase [Carboxydothermus islandicus]